MSDNNPNEIDVDQFDAISMEVTNAATSIAAGGAWNLNVVLSNGNRVAETALGSQHTEGRHIADYQAEVHLDDESDDEEDDESEEEIGLDTARHMAGGYLMAEGYVSECVTCV